MEVEIKLTGATEKLFRSVGDAIGPYRLSPSRHIQIIDTYYDTPDRDLARRSIALRRREQDGVAFYTLKAKGSFDGGVVRREEVEVEATPENWQMLLDKAGAPAQLAPLLTIRTDRLQREVTLGGAPVAVAAFDLVEYGPGLQFRDIEFELAPGAAEEHLHRLAASLPGLTASDENKLQRGLRVMGLR